MRSLILALAILFFGLSAIVAYGYILDRMRSKDSRTWPSTEGTVVETGVAQGQDGTPSRSRTYYSPYVRYEYRVNGEDYWNVGGEFEQAQFRAHKEAEQAIQHNVGDTIPVYYMKTNPSFSLLIRGGGGVSIVRLLASIVIGGIGAFLFWLWRLMRDIER